MSLMTAFVVMTALFAAISLFDGIVSMAHGGAHDQRESHWLMFRRVGWQAPLAFLFVLFALLSNLKERSRRRHGTAAPGTGSGGSLEQFHYGAGCIHVK